MLAVRGNIVDVETGRIEKGTLFVRDGMIVEAGDERPEHVLDYSGKYIVPGFIDAHVHIESSMLTPSNFARAVLPRGTVAVVADPHEIANVKGVEGVEFMTRDAEGTPLEVFFTAPSCVPATHMETAGAELGVKEIEKLLRHERCVALGEMMNFPGVMAGDEAVMAKIAAARKAGKPVDGHAPGLSGEALRKYVGAGISTDHECTGEEEALEKLGLGMKIMIREGSSMRNLESLTGIVSEESLDRLFLVSDDIHPGTILEEGHMDRILRRAVALGIRPEHALRMVTVNPARHYGLQGLGSLRPGSRACIAVLEDLNDFRVSALFVDGEMVAGRGRLVKEFGRAAVPESVLSSVNTAPFSEDDMKVESPGRSRVNVISVPNGWEVSGLDSDGRFLVPDRAGDVLPIAVVERHRATGNIGRGFVRGFGLEGGALASTVAHDSHNIVCVGENYADMFFAVESLRKAGGGIAAVRDGRLLGLLELPVAGLMSTEKAGEVHERLSELHRDARGLGCRIGSPFMSMAFLALPVIPKLKITDMGLVDVKRFRLIDVKLFWRYRACPPAGMDSSNRPIG
jgi:adenine deaminase